MIERRIAVLASAAARTGGTIAGCGSEAATNTAGLQDLMPQGGPPQGGQAPSGETTNQ